jgi:hypothetical protein
MILFSRFAVFIPEISSGFTSYTVQIVPIYFYWIANSDWLVSFDLKILSIIRQVTVYECCQSAYPPAARWFLALLIFDPEDGGDMFHRNVGSHKD